MGLGRFQAEFLLAEHRYRPITGKLLTIARQTVGMTPDQARQLLAATGTPLRPEANIAIDDKTRGFVSDEALILDESFYSMFSDAKQSILDVSDYEQADVIHDLNYPIPPSLENQYDFVLCGSCLDNIFAPVPALQNLVRLVKPGGRIFVYECGNSFSTAYLRFSPDWFLDFFAANRFADCKAYLLHYPNLDGARRYSGHGSYADVYYYDPLVEDGGEVAYRGSHPQSLSFTYNYVIAEKAPDSTWDARPIPTEQRRDEAVKTRYLDTAMQYRRSPRPLFRRPAGFPVNGDPALSRFGTLKPVASWEGDLPLGW